jgi:hypothetical protein
VSLALIQLVSEQTMQNVLPVLALRPERVFHFVTGKVAYRSAWITDALRQTGCVPRCEDICLTDMPTIPETASEVLRLIEEARQRDVTPIVNFTGGTKMMSIGAYAAASKSSATSLYVDTADRLFVDGHTGPPLGALLQNNLSFTPYQRDLTVSMIARAHGCPRVTNGRDFAPYLPLARYLRTNPEDERRAWEAFDGASGLTPRGMEPRANGEWAALCDRPVALPPAVAELASQAGMVNVREGQPYLAPSSPNSAARGPKFARTFFTGGWWEVAVADAVAKSGRFLDVRWSADAGHREAGVSLEEDVLAVDGVQIAYFSCKRGGARSRLPRQLEEMHASAERLGGRFASKYLCVCLPPPGSVKDAVLRRARELSVRVLTRDDLVKPDCFSTP